MNGHHRDILTNLVDAHRQRFLQLEVELICDRQNFNAEFVQLKTPKERHLIVHLTGRI